MSITVKKIKIPTFPRASHLLAFFAVFALSVLLTACGKQEAEPAKPAAQAAQTPAPAQAKDDSLQAIIDRGVLRVAVFADKPPFSYVDANGKNQGYDVELAKRLAKDLLGSEDKVEYVLTEAQYRVDAVRSGKVDLILANFTKTPERAEQVDFALPYMKVAIGVVSPKAAPIRSVQELAGKTLVVNKGTTAELYFAREHPDIALLSLDHNSEAFSALKDKRGAALSNDNTLLYAWARQNPDFVVDISQLGSTDFIAPAVKKGSPALLAWVNEEMEKLYAERFFYAAYDHAIKPFYGDEIDPKLIVVSEKPESAAKPASE
jgi:polar amino acid transport system substrate-binding protein